MNFKSAFFSLFLVLFATSCDPPSQNQLPPKINEVREENFLLRKCLDSLFSTTQITGLVIAITNKDSIIFSYAKGDAKIGEKRTISINTYFRVASISKFFIALSLKKLEQEGRLVFEEDVSNYLGFKFRNVNYPFLPIKLKSLINHTSGLRGDESLGSVDSEIYKMPLKWVFGKVNNSYSHHLKKYWANSKPGELFAYSNLAYVILASIIERVTKKDFNKHLKNSVFIPLSLKATFDHSDLAGSSKGYCYRNIGGNWVAQVDSINENKSNRKALGQYASTYSPMGGLRISASELSLVHREILKLDSTRKIVGLSLKSFQEMVNDTIVTSDKSFEVYSLGLHHTRQLSNGEEWIGHPGEAYGLLSGWYYNKEKGLGITIIIPGSVYKSTQTEFYDIEQSVHRIIIPYINSIQNHSTHPR